MSDRSIDVLDSHIRFTNPDRAADVLGTLRGPDLPPAVLAHGRLAAYLWGFGWQLEAEQPGSDVFRVQFTTEPQAPLEVIFEALRTVAIFVEEGSFILLRHGLAIQHLRFRTRRLDSELGRLAFVPDDGRGRLSGHVVVALHDRELSSIHADRLAHELVLPVLDTGIERFEIRAELVTGDRRHVRAAGRRERLR